MDTLHKHGCKFKQGQCVFIKRKYRFFHSKHYVIYKIVSYKKSRQSYIVNELGSNQKTYVFKSSLDEDGILAPEIMKIFYLSKGDWE